MLTKFKWLSTFFYTICDLLTNLNICPFNIFLNVTEALGRTFVGYLNKDRALITNFGFQIPLFIAGYINLILQ